MTRSVNHTPAPAMPEWSRDGRAADFARLSSESWDVLVIGGGITGAGIALDAASRGLKTALIEKSDFSSGTSSRSSKLIHGGLRYLREFQFKTTLEASREKNRLRKLAPHLVEDLPFLFPVAGGPGSRMLLGTGLWIYDIASGFPKGMVHRKIDGAEARRLLPGLPEEGIGGAYLYYDARADDCRLVMHVLKRAVMHDALAVNYVRLDGFEHEKGTLRAARVRDEIGGGTGTVSAKIFVNATGVWCDEIRRKDYAAAREKVRPSKGVHLVVPRSRLRNECAAVLASPEDQRIIFLIPWGDRTIVGTTDTEYSGDIDRPQAESPDVDYLLSLVNRNLPGTTLTRSDIVSTYAGLRPLLQYDAGHPSRASREHMILRSRNGLLSITGGKLTTYRLMARQVVNRICKRLGRKERSRTHEIGLFSAPSSEDPLVKGYGTEAETIRSLTEKDRSFSSPIVEGHPHILAEAIYALRHERAVRLTDILCRRTRLNLLAGSALRPAAEGLARTLAPLTGWDPHREIERFLDEASRHSPA